MEIRRTRRRRLTSGCLEVKSMMFPSIIHSVMMHNGKSFGETPNTGRMLGWERRLQITISWNKRCLECQRRTQHIKSPAANLFDFGQVLGGVSSERLDAHTIPIVAAFPDLCEPSGSEGDITLL